MPRISQKQAVLNGRGAVVQYATGSSAGGWFYRELVPGTKSYRTKRIEGAQTLEEAVSAATDVAFQLNSASAGSEAVLGGVLRRRTGADKQNVTSSAVSYTHLRAHETPEHLVCRLLLEKKK